MGAIESPAEQRALAAFLDQQRSSDLLRVCTAGSVDDGKSTLIGRLLYDSASVRVDELAAIAKRGGSGIPDLALDLALLTDGLRAEREQGITIDVAYRFFATARRRYILADTPGHVQYTRNMATGASTADAAIVLVDARKGLLPQSLRHASIAVRLGVRTVIVAINKMDLVGYAEPVYERIRASFEDFFATLGELRPPRLFFIPVNALAGDNVVRHSVAMPWYRGPALLELLEDLEPDDGANERPFRLSVQRVLRTAEGFRGYAGQIVSGSIAPGDPVLVLPSGLQTRVGRLLAPAGDLSSSHAPLSVCLTLADDLDVARGDLLCSPAQPAKVSERFTASLVWMHVDALVTGRRYLLKAGSRTVQAEVVRVLETSAGSVEADRVPRLEMNDLGLVEIACAVPLAVDRYVDNRGTGSFILIDRQSAATVAAGMVRGLRTADAGQPAAGPLARVSSEERTLRWGHPGTHLRLSGPAAFADAVERALFLRGAFVVRLEAPEAANAEELARSGVLVLEHTPGPDCSVAIDGPPTFVVGPAEALAWLQEQAIFKAADPT